MLSSCKTTREYYAKRKKNRLTDRQHVTTTSVKPNGQNVNSFCSFRYDFFYGTTDRTRTLIASCENIDRVGFICLRTSRLEKCRIKIKTIVLRSVFLKTINRLNVLIPFFLSLVLLQKIIIKESGSIRLVASRSRSRESITFAYVQRRFYCRLEITTTTL